LNLAVDGGKHPFSSSNVRPLRIWNFIGLAKVIELIAGNFERFTVSAEVDCGGRVVLVDPPNMANVDDSSSQTHEALHSEYSPEPTINLLSAFALNT
jgi:hypothetical protein